MKTTILAAISFGLVVEVSGQVPTIGNTVPCTVGGLTINLVGSNSTTAAASSYASSLYQPRQNTLLLASVVNSKASAPDTPTMTGNGLTWTRLRTTNYNTLASPTQRLTVFYAHSKSGATTNGAVADFAGVNQTGCVVTVVEIANAQLDGNPDATNAIVQVVHNGGGPNTNATVTFSALSGTRNLQLIFVGANLNSANNVAESGWTKIADQNYNTPATESTVVYKTFASDTSGLITNAAAITWATLGVEICQLGQFRP